MGLSWVKDIMLQRYTLVLQKGKPGLRMPMPHESEDLGHSTHFEGKTNSGSSRDQ